MGASLQREANGIWVLRLSGALRKEELDAVQAEALQELGAGENARLLVLVEDDFCGWIGDEVWGDISFFMEHGDRVVKIAIVGDNRWQDRMLIFAGAGLRSAPVSYFAPGQRAEALVWLC